MPDQANNESVYQRLTVKGFGPIRSSTLELRRLNVLIGANGSGKSSLLNAFRLLSFLHTGRLALFVAAQGHASSLLHYGPKATQQIEFELEHGNSAQQNAYSCRLAFAGVDELIFADERAVFHRTDDATPFQVPLGVGHSETRLVDVAAGNDKRAATARTSLNILRGIGIYHFHDTSPSAPVRLYSDIEESDYLRTNGRNLAAFLLRLKSQHTLHYMRIVETIRLIAPFFDDFVLSGSTRDAKQLSLRWRDKTVSADYTFGPNLISDGTLRAMCLITTLLQPDEYMPRLVVIDEPELGLHPYAIEIIAGLIKAASLRVQIVLATQSPQLVDAFEPSDMIIAERHGGETHFERLDPAAYEAWTKTFTVGELWEKNVIGGRPNAWSS